MSAIEEKRCAICGGHKGGVTLSTRFHYCTCKPEAPTASSYREGESVIASSHREPEAPPRERTGPDAKEKCGHGFTICYSTECTKPMNWTERMQRRHKWIESAFEKLQRERDDWKVMYEHTEPDFKRIANERDKLQAALDAKERELARVHAQRQRLSGLRNFWKNRTRRERTRSAKLVEFAAKVATTPTCPDKIIEYAMQTFRDAAKDALAEYGGE